MRGTGGTRHPAGRSHGLHGFPGPRLRGTRGTRRYPGIGADGRDRLINSGQELLELESAMKRTALVLLLAAAGTVAASSQTPAKPATSSTTAAKPATATHTAAAASAVKLPPGVPPGRGILKTAFSLKYQDIKVGTGAAAEPGKLYKVHYTGWLASNGSKFDSSYDHPAPPLKDKDGKPVLGADGKPTLGEPQPIVFPQGGGRVMPGFDQGFEGMKVGGKRRLFIPWQLAYGTRGRPGADATHPGIPPKADLIFDVELVDQQDPPTPPQRPGMPPGMRTPPTGITPHPPAVGTPGAPPAPGTPGAGTTPAPGTAPSAPVPPAPATTPAPATPPPATAPPA
jgi:peptidylprolyl isomerase